LSKDYNLHPALCFLDKTQKVVADLPPVEEHNACIKQAIASAKAEKKSFVIKENGCQYILVEDGKFYGMGKVEDDNVAKDVNLLKQKVTPYPENEVLKSMLRMYVERYPKKVMML
jgi:DNA polymerase-3 subunit epsilon